MSLSPFTPRFEDLPDTLPIFPLPGAVLLPRQFLPLNIFEPRYLSMVLDALRADRNIGMIQPRPADKDSEPVAVYGVGCAGRITAFQESDDGRLLIQLTGVCRFRAAQEIEMQSGYRRIRPSWRPYRADFDEPPQPPVGFTQLEPALRAYFQAKQLQASWDALKKLSAASLVDFLAANLPFDAAEKQALVEAPSVLERAQALQTALEMAARAPTSPGPTRH